MQGKLNRKSAEPQPPKLAATLAELIEVLESHFKRVHVSDDPHGDALAVIAVLAEHFGGRQFYLPRGDCLRRAQRDVSILAAYQDGTTIDTLARRHRLSTRRVRNILEQA